MTDTQNPIQALVQLQRETIKQTEEVAEGILERPGQFSDTVSTGIETQRELQEQALELSRQSIHRSMDATSAVSPDDDQIDELREMVDETFETLETQQADGFEAVEEGYNSFSEDAVETLGEQIDLLVDLNERVEEQLQEAVDRLSEEVGEPDEVADRLEEQLEELIEQFERGIERFGELETELEGEDADDSPE